MLDQTTVHGRVPNLDRMVYCAACGHPMTQEGGEYSCPNGGASKCLMHSAKADTLLKNVMAVLLKRVVTDETLDDVVKGVRDEVEPKATGQRDRMYGIEREIADLNRTKLDILEDVEQGNRSFPEAADEVNHLNMTGAGLAYESRIARDEMDRLEYIGNEEGIRDTLRNMKTYLESSNPEHVQELLQMYVEKVVVGPGRATVVYHQPIATGTHPGGIGRDRITLG